METVIITNQLPTDTSFGVTLNGEQVFIPPMVTRELDLKMGEKRELMLVPNHVQPERTPWCAIAVPVEAEKTGDLIDEVSDILVAGGIWTNATMYAEIYEGHADTQSKEYKDVGNALARLHTGGKIARAAIKLRPEQEKASAVLYAKDVQTMVAA